MAETEDSVLLAVKTCGSSAALGDGALREIWAAGVFHAGGSSSSSGAPAAGPGGTKSLETIQAQARPGQWSLVIGRLGSEDYGGCSG
jgi:hypothetical protein